MGSKTANEHGWQSMIAMSNNKTQRRYKVSNETSIDQLYYGTKFFGTSSKKIDFQFEMDKK